MSDALLRRLHRAWLESGSARDAETYDEACRRAGVLSEPRGMAYAQMLELLERRARTFRVITPMSDHDPSDQLQVVVVHTVHNLPVRVHPQHYTYRVKSVRIRSYLEHFVEVTLNSDYCADYLGPGSSLYIRVVVLEAWRAEHRWFTL